MASFPRLLTILLVLLVTAAACASSPEADDASVGQADSVDPTLEPASDGPASNEPTPSEPTPSEPESSEPASGEPGTTGELGAAAESDDPAARAPGDPAQAELQLLTVAEMDQPIAMAVRPGDQERVYVAERAGRVRPLGLDGTVGQPLVDITQGTTTESERGLLGLTWSPDGNQLYISSTDTEGATVIEVFDVTDNVLDTSSRRLVLRVPQPASNHNGGNIAFGPDGYLWIGLGDGGAADDAFGNGQRPDTLLGAMLRIDPLGDEPYGIPADNPFAGETGAPEVFSYGLRNPWRFSFDAATGDVWIADVGQNAVEEINRVPAETAGLNYGWPRFEGGRPFDGQPAATPVVDPVHTYDHSRGCSITGGQVYRGAVIPELQGAYLYSDFCNGRIFALATTADGSTGVDVDTGLSAESVVSFGHDAAGELYVLSLAGPVYRIAPR